MDAVFAWQAHIGEAEVCLGNIGKILNLNLFYHNSWLAVGMKDFSIKNPHILLKFLRALIKALDLKPMNRVKTGGVTIIQ